MIINIDIVLVKPIKAALKFNSIKHRREQSTNESISVRYSTAQETSVPTYVGLMLHDRTCMAVLILCMYTQNIIRQQNIH